LESEPFLNAVDEKVVLLGGSLCFGQRRAAGLLFNVRARHSVMAGQAAQAAVDHRNFTTYAALLK
jgi:hypothetical protein